MTTGLGIESVGALEGELERTLSESGKDILHADTVETPLTDLELDDREIGLGLPAPLPPRPRAFFMAEEPWEAR